MEDQKKRILVVDDEIELVEAISIRLKVNDYDILTAYDGPSGLEAIKKEKPDLVLLDLMIPRMNGIEVCRAVKDDQEYKDIPIIMLTAKTQKDDIREGEAAGANAYVTKPFEFSELLEKIKQFLA